LPARLKTHDLHTDSSDLTATSLPLVLRNFWILRRVGFSIKLVTCTFADKSDLPGKEQSLGRERLDKMV